MFSQNLYKTQGSRSKRRAHIVTFLKPKQLAFGYAMENGSIES